MFAGHMILETSPDKVSEIEGYWKDMTQQYIHAKGLKSAYLMVRRDVGECVVCGVWDTLDLANDFARSAHFQSFISKILPLLSKMPERKVYEVAGFWS